jgi:UDP-N-acetylglucosamine transferase subunit ALG13
MNIFVTVGTQLPFDRLVRAIDVWVGASPDAEAFGQIRKGAYTPENMTWADFLSPQEYVEKMKEADVIVSHAGIGSLMTAMELEKRIILFPRRYDLAEHRTDHQVATAARLGMRNLVHVAHTEAELYALLSNASTLESSSIRDVNVSPQLMASIHTFVMQNSA